MVMVSTLMYHTLESEIDAAMFLGSSYKQIMLMYPATHVIGQMLESGDYAILSTIICLFPYFYFGHCIIYLSSNHPFIYQTTIYKTYI
jgi:hypothetical protein